MEKQKIFIGCAFMCVVSFFLGRFSDQKNSPEPIFEPIKPEISVIHLKAIEGDTITGTLSGPARIVWNEANTIEQEGDFALPISQLPNESDKALSQMPYTGNAKTNKFYPSDSYPARGVEVQYRRLFESKQAALDAGFEASKLVE